MSSLRKNRSGIRQQIALFGLSLFCLCADVRGMAAGGNQQNENFLAGTHIPGRVAHVLRDLCLKVYDGREGLRGVEGIERDFSLFLPDQAERAGDLSGVVSRLTGTNSLVVTFPGSRTESPRLMERDWASNFDILRPRGDDGFSAQFGEREFLVHPGYARKVNGYWNNMMTEIENAGPFDEIYFTGHSKGGGVALLSALKYAHENPHLIGQHRIKVVTFCAPPVFWGAQGTQLFYGHLDHSDVARFYKTIDLIPSIPQITRLAHVGSEFPVGVWDGGFGTPRNPVPIWSTMRAFGVNKRISATLVGVTSLAGFVFGSHSMDQFTHAQIDQHIEV